MERLPSLHLTNFPIVAFTGANQGDVARFYESKPAVERVIDLSATVPRQRMQTMVDQLQVEINKGTTMYVVVTGVETHEQARYLRSSGCENIYNIKNCDTPSQGQCELNKAHTLPTKTCGAGMHGIFAASLEWAVVYGQ
jgi:hypothetical protein